MKVSGIDLYACCKQAKHSSHSTVSLQHPAVGLLYSAK